MTPTPLALIAALALPGCGTQIGTEDELICGLVSSETLTDLTAVPEGFELSPRDTIDALLGSFTGHPFSDEVVDTGPHSSEERFDLETAVALTVSDPGGDVVLERYEESSGDEALAEHCPSVFVVELDYTLEADGLPTFSGAVSTALRDQPEGAHAETADTGGFVEEPPGPTLFDPDDFDTVELHVRFSGRRDVWWPHIRWEAWNTADVEPDGDVSKEGETLLDAEVTPASG